MAPRGEGDLGSPVSVEALWAGGKGGVSLSGTVGGAGGLFAPAAPTRPVPGGCRPQTPLIGLNGLVLKRRTG
ncbi:hypothetical protein GCM10018775_10160 [Streptomyces umbrinus]|nr:hypothetical protein GCM10018775_10160 [Streptomyces umbrinus]